MNIPFSLVKWKFNEVYPKNSETFKVGLTDRLTSMPLNLRLSPDRLMVIPLFVSEPPSDGTSNWIKSFSYWFPAKSFTVFALDGNDPQVCSRSQPARIGVVSVFLKFNWVPVWYQTSVILCLRCGEINFEPDLDISDIDESENFTWSKRRFTFNMRCSTVSLEPWRWWLSGGDGVALV